MCVGGWLLKILIPRLHPSPMTSESSEGGAQVPVLFKAVWVMAVRSPGQEPLTQLESSVYAEAVLGKAKPL